MYTFSRAFDNFIVYPADPCKNDKKRQEKQFIEWLEVYMLCLNTGMFLQYCTWLQSYIRLINRV
jgi:hypothetical protein